jgi:hypothetical protein
MTATPRGHVSAFLLRAGLFGTVLAVIAGILGMHGLTGNHSTHSTATMTATAAGTVTGTGTVHGDVAVDGHAGHKTTTADSMQTASTPGMTGTCTQLCPGACTSMDAQTVSCTPSLGSASLAAPLPGRSLFGSIPGTWMAGALPRAYPYLPTGPSPGELSVSRT